jgi:hypothetical protein
MSAAENYLYIGPTIPGKSLKRNTLYMTSALPDGLEELVQEAQLQSLKCLYIPVGQYFKASKQLKEKGSLEHTANEQLLAIARTIPR